MTLARNAGHNIHPGQFSMKHPGQFEAEINTRRPISSRPWENGYCESSNSKLRDELLNGELFFSLAEAQVLIEAWRRRYNAFRPPIVSKWLC